jgi:hypothetical protein
MTPVVTSSTPCREVEMLTRKLAGIAVAAVGLALSSSAVAGAAYTVTPSPNAFVGNNALNGVSADSATDAWAVGYLCCSARHSGLGSLTERWNGTAWRIVPSPDTLFFDEVLNGVAALTPANAWAVGFVKQSGFRTGNPLIVHWNGSAWQTAAPPSGLTGTLRSVSADAASDVWAVGDDGHGSPVVLRFNGASWSRVSIPLTGVLLEAVKAFSPSNVWIVGGAGAKSLVLHFNGSAWSVVPSPSPDPTQNLLQAVGGRSSSDLWAVGRKGADETTTGVPPGTRTLTMHFNGSSWSAVASPSVGDQDTLTGVAPLGTTATTAVGTYENRSGSIPIDRTLAENFNGSSWLVQSSPNVGPSDNLLQGVTAVPGTGKAFAVGFHLQSSGPYQTLILTGS